MKQEAITRMAHMRQSLGTKRGSHTLRFIRIESERYGVTLGLYRTVSDVAVQLSRLCPVDEDVASAFNELGEEFLVCKREHGRVYNVCPLATSPTHTVRMFFDRTA